MALAEPGVRGRKNKRGEHGHNVAYTGVSLILTAFFLTGQWNVCHILPHLSKKRITYSSLIAERRSAILNQILEPEAVDRLNRIRLVKESRAADIESRLIMLAQTGQLRQKVTEEQLKDLLNAISENQRKAEEESKIVISRRKGGWDDDDDLLDL